MSTSEHYIAVEKKLKDFIRKFYMNEILRGSILFLAFGLLYFLFTLLLEHFLWLDTFWRTVLFWAFIGIELLFIVWWIFIPLLKLIGMKQGLSAIEASLIIGRHFKEVEDKLLNIIQLKSMNEDSDLVIASIEQKAKELQPVPFKRAVLLKSNMKYARYLFIPLLLWFLFWITGNKSVFTQSLNRVVHHQTAFSPPAPFQFVLLNDSLRTVEDEDYVLRFKTEGEVVPEEVRILYQEEVYFVKRSAEGILEHTFLSPDGDIEFVLQGNDYYSNTFNLEVLVAPKITDFKMYLQFPEYLGSKEEFITNTGNAQVPEGSIIKWEVGAKNTEELEYIYHDGLSGQEMVSRSMQKKAEDLFELEMIMDKSMHYSITSSNSRLKAYETLQYSIEVVPDEYPGINVYEEESSPASGFWNFLGTVTDDHGITRVQVVAKNSKTGALSIGRIPIGRSDFEEFYYSFPEGLVLEDGEEYEIYFEVFDNDGINGSKRAVSGSFFYRSLTDRELENEILQEQQNSMESIEKQSSEEERAKKDLEKISEELKTKDDADWKDRKKIEEYLERQESYQQMMKENADQMKQSLQEQEDEDPELQKKREELIKRWEEIMDVQDKDDLLKELEKIAELLEKDALIEKMEELKELNKQEKRSLERILELTRQYYVEKKSSRLKQLLEELAKKQDELSEEGSNSSEEQEKLNKEFEDIGKEFDELREQNESLKKPIPLYESKSDEKLIKMEMEEAKSKLEAYEKDQGQNKQEKGKKAQEKQKSSARKMEELSKKMERALMQMQMENNLANMEDLKQILKNLVIFSHDQENLMLSLENVSDKSAEFPEKLKEQIKLKEHFEHIDDSIYVLSMELVDLSVDLDKDLAAVHYNLNSALENLSENRIDRGRSNQHYTMTSANEIANMLSDLLQSMQNQSMGSGKGQGEEELNLPDIIKKQSELKNKVGQGKEQKQQDGGNGKERLSEEQFQMYQEQRALREKLERLMQNKGRMDGDQKILDQMEELERLLLEKGINQDAFERMRQLEHELLELEDATLKRNKDLKREAERAKDYPDLEGDAVLERELEGMEQERLRRKSLKLQQDYQKRVKQYFEKEKK